MASANIKHTLPYQAGHNYWLVVDKHMTDFTGTSCNKIGATHKAFLAMERRCYRKEYT